MKRPIVVFAVGYIIGIVWGLYCKCNIALLYAIVISISIITKKNYKSKKLKLFSFKRYIRYVKIFFNKKIIITIIISSIISYTTIINQNKRYNNLYNEINEVTLTGVVVSNCKSKEFSNTYKIKVNQLNGSTNYKNTYLLINIKKNNNNKIEYGNEVEIQGKFIKPTVQRNYKGFDYKEYLKTQKVYGTVNVDKVKIKNKQCINIIFLFANKISMKIKNNFKKIFPEELSHLIVAIIFGDTEELEEEIVQNFRDSNMAHILAISGMHITYIISGLMSIFMASSIGKRKSRILVCIILVIYLFLTGFSPSVFRAVIMGILHLGSSIFYRKNDIWTSISISLLLIIIYNPFLIKSISVYFTYFGTIGIIVFNETITTLIEKIDMKNKKYKYKIEKRLKSMSYIKASVCIALSVQIMIMPMYVYFFNRVNLSFIIIYLLVGKLIESIIIIGFLAIICSLIKTEILKILSFVLSPLLKVLIIISELGKKIPLSKVYIGTPNVVEMVLYYIFIFILFFIIKVYNSKKPTAFEYRIRNIISLVKYKFRKKKKKLISIILIISIMFSFLIIIPKSLKIYFIDVGQGDSTLIVTPMHKSILIDGGGSLTSSYDVGKNTLLPYLLARRITKIDYIFVSHFDQDHVGRIAIYNPGIKS